MAKIRGATPEEYFANVPAELRPRARQLHRTLVQALPRAQVQIKWGQPAFVDGTILVSYAVFAKHINLYTTPSSREALAGELSGHRTGKGSIQLPHDEPLPIGLVKRVAAARAQEYLEHGVLWMS
ncbi:MAG: DUF1801 domain-containing protein [Paeniglutamicibacter sp.]